MKKKTEYTIVKLEELIYGIDVNYIFNKVVYNCNSK